MRVLLLISVIALLGCGPRLINNPEAVEDVLITFTVNAQAGNYSRCLELITYDEQLKMLEPGGEIKEEFRAGMNRMRLSALQRYNFKLDYQGRLVGMYAAIADANRSFKISEEQRRLTLDDIEKRQRDRLTADSLRKAENAPPPPVPTTETEENSAEVESPPVNEEIQEAEEPAEAGDFSGFE